MTEYWRFNTQQLTQGYVNGDFTPVEVLQSCLFRAESCQPSLNALVAWDRDGAMRDAKASGRRWRRAAPLSHLDGVPMTVKDNLHMAGLPISWGSRLLHGHVADIDEEPVARLRAGGALLFGKTNLPEFAMQGHTANDVFGATRNPWNPALTPGGSSGGAAAAVAAGCGPLALATDGGGSIRRPASHCGLVGLKPSAGLVPRSGGLPEIFLDFEVAGGLGRTVDDVARLLGVLCAADLSAPAPSHARILFMPQFGAHPVDPDIAHSVNQAAAGLVALGHHVELAPSLDAFESVNEVWPDLSRAGLAWMDAATPLDLTLCGKVAQDALTGGRAMTAADMFEVMHRVQMLGQQLKACFARCDFIMTPATAALPWPVGQDHPLEIDGKAVGPRGHAVFTAFANAAGLPAIALPSGLANGLPTGMQLVGPKGSDAALLALSRQFEAAYPWIDRWPPFAAHQETAT